ncbi:hypothetical protein MRX96_013420 [Rhipicephalus microplus]
MRRASIGSRGRMRDVKASRSDATVTQARARKLRSGGKKRSTRESLGLSSGPRQLASGKKGAPSQRGERAGKTRAFARRDPPEVTSAVARTASPIPDRPRTCRGGAAGAVYTRRQSSALSKLQSWLRIGRRYLPNVLWEVLDDALTHVARILTAVSCCMLLVVVTIKLSPHFLDNGGDTLPYTPLPDTDEQVSFTRATNATANAFLLIGVVITMTVLMVTLYYYRFYSIIGTWITLACAIILVMSPVTYIDIVFQKYNVPADIFSVGLFVYNFMALGLVVVLYKGPMLLQQFYLIVESSYMSIMLLKFLPAWTLWVVLGLIPIWDLVAVLAVVGPLRILVETAQERKEGLQPGLVFSTMVVGTFPGMAKRHSERRPSKQRRSHGRRTS